jgi:hypothetical protein
MNLVLVLLRPSLSLYLCLCLRMGLRLLSQSRWQVEIAIGSWTVNPSQAIATLHGLYL